MGDVGDFDAGSLQLVADAVGLGEILGLLGVLTGHDLGLHRSIALAALGHDGELSGGDGLVMPIIDEEDRRQARGAFCAKYAAGRPYFMVRAKTPQLVLDEIDKLMEQLGMN